MIKSLDRIYSRAPLWAQTLGINVFGLVWRWERLGGDFKKHVAGFRERDRWQIKAMDAYVQTELRRVLLHAFAEVPYYQKRWSEAGITKGDLEQMTPGDISKLPATPKRDVRADPEAFVARDVAARQKLHPYRTSGSSGTPVTALYTVDAHRRFIAAREARSFGWAGVSLRSPRAVIGGRMVAPRGCSKPPFHRYNWVERQVYLSAFHIAPQNVGDYVLALNRYQPKVMTGYAYSYYALASMMQEQGFSLDYCPQALILVAEKTTPEMKLVLEKIFRAPVYQEYGSAENCVLATECEHGRLHSHPDFGILELADDQGQPVPPGADGYVLGTSLLNEAQPLIRYELGDVGVWSADKCPCHRDHLPVLAEIVGRLDDALVGPDGRKVARFSTVFKGLHVLECQLIQESRAEVTVKVVPAADYGSQDEWQIRTRIVDQLGPVRVKIQRVPEIPRTERGKFRGVICKLPRQEVAQAQDPVDLRIPG